jgi:hypothetical protein
LNFPACGAFLMGRNNPPHYPFYMGSPLTKMTPIFLLETRPFLYEEPPLFPLGETPKNPHYHTLILEFVFVDRGHSASLCRGSRSQGRVAQVSFCASNASEASLVLFEPECIGCSDESRFFWRSRSLTRARRSIVVPTASLSA